MKGREGHPESVGTLLLQLASQARPGQQPLTHVFLDLAGMMVEEGVGLVWLFFVNVHRLLAREVCRVTNSLSPRTGDTLC